VQAQWATKQTVTQILDGIGDAVNRRVVSQFLIDSRRAGGTLAA
jgi:hypothetical protein